MGVLPYGRHLTSGRLVHHWRRQSRDDSRGERAETTADSSV